MTKMPSNIPAVVDELVRRGIIGAEQKDEVLSLFGEMRRGMLANAGYQMMDSIRKTIPESMLQLTKDITYEDSMILTFAVQASNIKKAGRFFEPVS